MGYLDWLTQIHHFAVSLVLGFALVALVALAFLSGHSGPRPYDPDSPTPPIEHFGGWVREAHGQVPVFMKVWIAAIATWALALTGIVIWHGYRY